MMNNMRIKHVKWAYLRRIGLPLTDIIQYLTTDSATADFPTRSFD
jgi:hypothetical protein